MYFPIVETTVIDDSGYGIYKRRNDSRTMKKSGIDLHNGYVVPYNPGLLRRYQAYINDEWTPAVERLPFHLKDQQSVIFDASESIDYALDKASINETKFKAWMELNQTDTFAQTLLYGDLARFYIVWEKTWRVMAEDVLNVERKKLDNPDLQVSDIERKNICLTYIECMLRSNNKSLKDIQNMLYPDQNYMMDGYNRLIYEETSYKKEQLREQHVRLYHSLIAEHKGIYSTVIDAVDNNKGGMFFVYGYGGTGKTYLYKTMSAALHSKGDIVLNVASSGIATLLLEGERTTHLRFAIPINVVEDSMCHIPADSDLADLIRKKQSSLYGMRHQWKVGGENDDESNVLFPDNMLIPKTDDDEKAILAPTHEMIDIVNKRMPTLLSGDERSYESLDSVCLADDDSNFDDSIYTTESLNGLRMSDIPHHNINLKIAKIISDGSTGTICAIPRMIISPTDTKMPFKLNRRQFPIQVYFAMTPNKSKGQTLSQAKARNFFEGCPGDTISLIHREVDLATFEEAALAAFSGHETTTVVVFAWIFYLLSKQEDKLEEDYEVPIRSIFQGSKEVIHKFIDDNLDDDNDRVLFRINSGETLNVVLSVMCM
nr:ATP-dependent DNA helicase PIF1-like [Tanacetum cinerariifolium]